MPGEVQAQADIASVSLYGLENFSTVLSTISADNVDANAVIQMAQLGACFPINGPFADSIKDLLQRCGNIRLNRLKLLIGWRRHDSASLMAESAGGQAIALVSSCLRNVLRHEEVGQILYSLSREVLAKERQIASVSQLADVAQLLSAKVEALGFGNHLAREVTRLHDAYTMASADRRAPSDLLDQLNVNSISELLKIVSQVLRDDEKICRITGNTSMGHVVGLLEALFPRNTSVTVLGVITKSVEYPHIWCEITAESSNLMCIRVETKLERDVEGLKIPIGSTNRSESDKRHQRLPYCFSWSNCLGDLLRLTFLNYGLRCERSMLEAYSNLITLMPESIFLFSYGQNNLQPGSWKPESSMSLITRMGSLARADISSKCEITVGCQPTASQMNLKMAVSELKRVVGHLSASLNCGCRPNSCKWDSRYSPRQDMIPNCRRRILWSAIIQILEFGFWSLFIDAEPRTVMQPKFNLRRAVGTEIAGQVVTNNVPICLRSNDIMRKMFYMFGEELSDGTHPLIVSPSSCAIYPAVLETLALPDDRRLSFKLVEGKILYQRRPHNGLSATPINSPRTSAAVNPKIKSLYPSNLAVHAGEPTITIHEEYKVLYMKCFLNYENEIIQLNLRDVINGFIRLRWPEPCVHSSNAAIDTAKHPAQATSLKQPGPTEHKEIGIVMTRHSAEAQFFSCRGSDLAILQKDCCLNCAAEQLPSNKKALKHQLYRTIIIG